MNMTSRWIAYSLIGTLIGALLASGVQIGGAVVRYEIDTPWLDQTVLPLFLLAIGMVGAVLFALPLAFAQSRLMRRMAGSTDQSRTGRLTAAFAVAMLLDPYYLAYISLTFAPNWQWELRVLAVALIAIAQIDVFGIKGRARTIWMLTGAAAVLAHALIPRYALVPLLPETLEIASQSPIHILVFVKAIILLLLANAVAISQIGGQFQQDKP